MYTFHGSIHARPATAIDGGTIRTARGTLRALHVPREAQGTPWELSFEEASRRLEALPRMFIEPDGAWLWVGGDSHAPWQLEGVLYDRDGRLLYVELKGRCPSAEFDRLLAALAWPQTPLMFQLAREAVVLDEAEFRRVAAAALVPPEDG